MSSSCVALLARLGSLTMASISSGWSRRRRADQWHHEVGTRSMTDWGTCADNSDLDLRRQARDPDAHRRRSWLLLGGLARGQARRGRDRREMGAGQPIPFEAERRRSWAAFPDGIEPTSEIGP